ncbi:tyrosine-type recombinase/integrase [Falsochrobactrum ovis]|uniref:Site-specific recombinase XerD n=1 Tax=Falsochrobactrum ovis TaxID=1293442 RepID=A0A364JRY1_9HYPH|nr:site-specific integrase [Falsochrobactrum ovis]RAK25619.1 site-specific recombinase XerD [Falsochrobactrum ovis]
MSERFSLRNLIDLHADSLWQNGSHKKSALIYLEEIAEIFPEEFTKFEADRFDFIVEALKARNNKNSTVNRKINALTKLLRAAQTSGHIPHVPMFRRLSEDHAAVRFLSKDEERLLLSVLNRKSPHYNSLAAFLIDTGVTLGEAIAIKWDHIDARTVRIPESSMGLARTLPLTTRAYHLLENLQGEPRGPFNSIDQHPFRVAWNEVRNNLDLADDAAIVPTVLRHTCACRLIIKGLNLHVVQKWLGNRDYKSMLKYQHLATSDSFDLCLTALEEWNAKR